MVDWPPRGTLCTLCPTNAPTNTPLSTPQPENESMVAGRRLHEHLEAACQLPDAVEIPIESAEDLFAARLLDTLCKLSHLDAAHPRVREVWVAAYLQPDSDVCGVWVTGVVDELQYDNDRIVVVDDKTRMRPVLPHERRQTATRLQVALYRCMLQRMADNRHALADLAALRGLDVHAPLSQPLVQALLPFVHTDAAQQMTLATSLPILQGLVAAAIPALSSRLCVRYLLRGTGEEFASVEYVHDQAWLQARLCFHLRFLGGGAAPECAQLQPLCFHCAFWNSCRAGRVVLGYPPTRPY